MRSLTVALDLGGTRIKIGIIRNESLAADSIIDAHSGKGLVFRLPAIEAEIGRLLSEVDDGTHELDGIGISIPGIVDSKRMRLVSVNAKFADAVGFDFESWAMKKWGVRVVIENDARSALIGEWQYGAGKGCDNLAMVTLGTGIGGAVVIEGKVLRGAHFQAGILPGHFTVNVNGTRCNCGNLGCVEAEASTWSLPVMARANPLFATSMLSQSDSIDYKELFAAADKGDKLALELVDHSFNAWSACVVNLIHAYDPELVVMGGGIIRNASGIIREITSRVHKHAWTPWGKVRIVPAERLDYAALLGVSFLLNEERF